MFNRDSHILALLLAFAGLFLQNGLGAPLPPDLKIETHDEFVQTVSNQKFLRFSSWTVNDGLGTLELRAPGPAHPDGTWDVYQRVYNSDDTWTDYFAGAFAVVNGRLRFTDSADYFLKEVTANDSVGGVLGSTEKVAYCLGDTAQYPYAPPATPPPNRPSSAVYGGTYPACGQIMGVTIGWYDNYNWQISSQSIPLAGISDGIYWLENVADPLNRWIETDNTNNTFRKKVTIATGLSPEINLVGNGQSIVNNDAIPSASDGTDFGQVDVVGDSLTRTFTIQNTGTGSLSLTGVPKVQITGSSDFSVALQPVSPVKISSPTTTFQITFNPSSTGPRTATVTIASNDASEGSYQFAIQGSGVPDTDGDGEDDISESISGTNPNDANSIVRTGKQLNISTRLDSQAGDNVGIGGFIISGAAAKTVVVRGLGPSLAGAGVVGALPDPALELHDQNGALLQFNNDWKDTQQTEIGNTGLAPSDDHEAAIVRSLAPARYTAILRGNSGATGIGLVEVYDIEPNSASTLANVSTRGLVGTGDSVMIGGQIIGNGLGANGAGSVRVLVRALGPSLPSSISNLLQDPVLDLRDGNGALIASNDDWRSSQESAIQATGLAPNDNREPAILATLTKGGYTAILRGKNNTTGVALVEAYKVQ
jgi:hypothetical protein